MPDLPPVKVLPIPRIQPPAPRSTPHSSPAQHPARSDFFDNLSSTTITRSRLVILPALLFLSSFVALTFTLSPSLRFSRLGNVSLSAASVVSPVATPNAAASTLPVAAPPHTARASLQAWMDHLRATDAGSNVTTARVACREMEAGAQSCVFEGVACINTGDNVQEGRRPTIFLLHEGFTDNITVPTDNWCKLRHYSSDPRYFSSRHWPIMNGTVVPQMSCLDAHYRHPQSVFHSNISADQIRWEPDGLFLVDLDYVDNPHNNHLLKDILWILDTALFQDSLSVQQRPGYPAQPENDSPLNIFKPDTSKIYLPQTRAQFEKQTSRDVNRLTYSIILRRNLYNLYPNLTLEELHRSTTERRLAQPMMSAHPELESKLVFHGDALNSNTQLVCTPRLTAGAKIGNGGHERVCRYLREKSYELYGIKMPPRTSHGQIFYSQPPKRVVILQRHVTRKIDNLDELYQGLRTSLEPHGVVVEVVSTQELNSAEANVRIFSSAGVLLSSHGSQNMGQIWMRRHSALIEVMPVGYTDYAFNLLSDSCRLWYYELQSLPHPNKTDDYYMEKCGKFKPHMMNPCVSVKTLDVTVNVSEAVRTVRFALERMGHSLEPWMDFVRNG